MTDSTKTATRSAAATGRAPDAMLRTVLRVDGWSTAAFGVVLLAGGSLLADPLGLPVSWSLPLGVAMLAGAAALLLIAGRPHIPARASATVVCGNALACLGMLLLTFTGLLPLTGLGVAFMVSGAVVVAIFTELEFAGHRRSVR